ncbi:MAG: penicillin-binding protein 1A [Magnetococcus sp. DMHC-6]
MLIAGLIGAGTIWGIYTHFAKNLPTLNKLIDYQPSVLTRVYARDYQLLGEFFIERRQFVPLNEIPQQLINAFLAIEDDKFYQHMGINIPGMFRAMFANIRAGGVVQGASTITQQVAKTFFLTPERTLQRKIQEIILAFRIEETFTKSEILELYLNQILLGSGAYGVEAAARTYFDKDVANLSLAQMALLAGLPKAPSRYNPWMHKQSALDRQKLVLERMVTVGFITAEEAKEAAAAEIELARPDPSLEQIAPHYLEHVRRTILAEWGQNHLYKGGLDIYTALDPPLQRQAREAVMRGLITYDRRHGYRGPLEHMNKVGEQQIEQWLQKYKNTPPTASGYLRALVLPTPSAKAATLLLTTGEKVELPLHGVLWARKRLEKDRQIGPPIKRLTDVIQAGDTLLLEPPSQENPEGYRLAQEPDAEAALVSLDPHTGQVLAMVGGYDFKRSEFNRATQGRRQPGSSFKPFIYAAALDNGFSPVSVVDDSPILMQYRDSNGSLKTWRPENYEHKFFGPTTVRTALEHSRNLVTIRLLQNVGIATATKYINRFGLEIPPNLRNLTLALGSGGFSPIQLASAYGVFANGGKLVPPVYIARIQDRFGRTIFRHTGGDCLLCHQEPNKSLLTKAPPSPLFGSRVLSRETAYQVTSLLKGVIERGTATRAKILKRPLAGKTGTTNDLKDAWFIGYSPSLVTAVWVGLDDFTTLGYRETGAQAALPIWIDFMKFALKDLPVTDFSVPPGIQMETVDLATGVSTNSSSQSTVLEAFRKDQMPNKSTPTVVPQKEQIFNEGLY